MVAVNVIAFAVGVETANVGVWAQRPDESTSTSHDLVEGLIYLRFVICHPHQGKKETKSPSDAYKPASITSVETHKTHVHQ